MISHENFRISHTGDPIGLIFGILAPQDIYKLSMNRIWLILIFGRDMGSYIGPEGHFLAILADF